MLFLAVLGYFWPVIGNTQSLYSCKVLVNCIFTSVLVRFDYKMQPGDNNVIQIAIKMHFHQKIAKKWIFEEGAKKYSKMEVRFLFSTKKYVKVMKFQSFLAILTLHFLKLPD